MPCKICGGESSAYAETTVRRAFPTSVFRCKECGFIFFHPITWLKEAYENVLNQDVGYIWRNLQTSQFLDRYLLFSKCEKDYFCDYGGGYGMLVRLMRDKGFRFHWYDPLAKNLFATCCEAVPKFFAPYRAVTAIEVFEHLPDPLTTVIEIAKLGSQILFTTELVPEPYPNLKEWWYFGPGNGQHVSFYSRRSLELLAEGLQLSYFELGSNWHVIGTREDIAMAKAFRASQNSRWRFRQYRRRKSLNSLRDPDFKVTLRLLDGNLPLSPAEPKNIDWIVANKPVL